MKSFDRFGVMLDCSRNAVLTVDAVKRYIDLIKRLGYNCLMLYTEDTYEISNRPFFGYLRGRYSKNELRELVAYANDSGIELMPCIQTLAHLGSLTRWNEFRPLFDNGDILLCGDEKTYELIDDMFSTLAECFTSRTVNIGMDEAYFVGLGKYLQQHGYQNRFEILNNHLTRVVEIAKKYGFSPIMWSDMFYRVATGGGYSENVSFDSSMTDKVPPEVGLVYWDYYSSDKKHYESLIKTHKQFNNEIWFAGGLWCWNGFAPRNGFTLDTLRCSIPVCIEQGIRNAFMTLWGDNGAECSFMAVLPSLYYAAQLAKGISDERVIKEGFEKEFGIPFDDFMLLDLPETAGNAANANSSQEKYMLYSDPFLGYFDADIPDGFTSHYGECASKLARYEDNPEYGLLFAHYRKLCLALEIKYTLGLRTRSIYDSHESDKLPALIDDYNEAISRIRQLHKAFYALWISNNKPHGFDIQDQRFGGLILRLECCRDRLIQLQKGEIDRIEELDERLLSEFNKKLLYYNNWGASASINVI